MSAIRYLALEAVDRAGKSTQIALLEDRIRRAGLSVIDVRFPNRLAPGTGPWLDRYLRGDFPGLSALPGLAEPDLVGVLLAQAAFALNRRESAGAISDLLATHDVVLADRSALSGRIYAEAMGVPGPAIERLQALIEGDVVAPDLIVVLDLDPAVAAARARSAMDAFDRDAGLQSRVRAGYLAAAERDPRVVLIDADGTPGEVSERIAAALTARGLPLAP